MRRTAWRIACALLALLTVACIKTAPPVSVTVRPAEGLLSGTDWRQDAVFYEVFVRSWRGASSARPRRGWPGR